MGLRSQLHKLEGLQSCHLPHLIELVEKCSTRTMRRAFREPRVGVSSRRLAGMTG
jgi:hypothetical protein